MIKLRSTNNVLNAVNEAINDVKNSLNARECIQEVHTASTFAVHLLKLLSKLYRLSDKKEKGGLIYNQKIVIVERLDDILPMLYTMRAVKVFSKEAKDFHQLDFLINEHNDAITKGKVMASLARGCPLSD